MLVILYSGMFLMPAIIFSTLTSGVSVGGSISFVVALLAIELAALMGSSLSKQEVFILWSCSGVAATDVIFLSLLQNLYFRSISSVTWQFKSLDTALPLPLAIPDWFAPSPNSPVLLLRTFLHHDWLLPIAITLAGWILSGKVIDLALGFLFFKIYSDEEKLPFPMQEVTAQMILTLPEEKSSKKSMLTITALIAFVYNIILYAVPFTTSFSIVPIPIPWMDFSNALESFLPGATFGIATDLLTFASGFITPLNVVVSMFIGAFSFFFIGNYFAAQSGLFTWTPGMNLSMLYQRSILYVWAYPNIGLAIAAALIPIITRPKYLVSAFKGLSRFSYLSREKGELSLLTIFLLYFGSSIIIILIITMLTEFPLYIALPFVFGWSFISSMISTRSVAVSGFQVTVPYVREALILASGYNRVDVWFAPMGSSGGAAWWASWFKLSELLETNYMDVIKGQIIASIVAIVFSFIYVSLFWSISPIPSPLYPAVDIYWPVNILMSGLWITGAISTGNAVQTIIGTTFLATAVSFLTEYLKIPFSLIGFLIGTSSPLPTSVTAILGAIFGVALRRIKGENWYKENKSVIGAGLFLGSSLAITIGVASAMILKGGWSLPY